jgi:hypothetical protein
MAKVGVNYSEFWFWSHFNRSLVSCGPFGNCPSDSLWLEGGPRTFEQVTNGVSLLAHERLPSRTSPEPDMADIFIAAAASARNDSNKQHEKSSNVYKKKQLRTTLSSNLPKFARTFPDCRLIG